MSKISKVAPKRLFVMCVACLFVCAALALTGCSTAQQDSQATEQQTANRQYMTQVNQKVETLASELDRFSDAVSRDDLVSMRKQADNASAIIDELSSLDVPDDMADIQKSYVDGCASLEEALASYIDLYSDIENATDAQPFDYSTYSERLQAIQSQYDDGISKLKAGDEAATAKK